MADEHDVLARSVAWDAALLRNDAALVGGFMTDDWVYVSPTGITPKDDIIGWIASGRLVHRTMETVGRPRVVKIADTVLCTARKLSAGLWDGAEYVADELISEVYVRADRTWRCAFSQKSPVTPG